MTIAQTREAGRFVFKTADWKFYQDIRKRLDRQSVFATYYKGMLEVVTTSYLHERISFLLHRLLCILAEETNTPMVTAGRTTLDREDLDLGVEADTSFYIAHVEQMKGKEQIDLKIDPPPDLAIEVEVSRRLGARKLIYRDIGVPELWRFADEALTVMRLEDGNYIPCFQSPTFPQLSAAEMSKLINAGLNDDETNWAMTVRRRVRETLAS